MFKSQEDQVAILGVCVDEPARVGRFEGLNYCAVRSGRRAIDMMRMLSFDLILVGMRIPDVSSWDFVRRMRTAWSWQKWALVGGNITDQQEITARMFGATKIFDVMPSTDELLDLSDDMRQKAAQVVVNSKFPRNLTLNVPSMNLRSASL